MQYFLHSQAKLLFQSFDHVDSLEQGYSINFIWGPDYRLEHLKGAKGVGGLSRSFSGGPIKLEIKFKCLFSSKN